MPTSQTTKAPDCVNGASHGSGAKHCETASAAQTAPRRPLTDGSKVEIDQELILQVEAATKVKLPSYPPDLAVIEPVAEEFTDSQIRDHVEDHLRADATICESVAVSGLLKQACQRRREELSRKCDRLSLRQDAMPNDICQSELGFQKGLRRREFSLFWCNWSGLALAGCFAWLVGTAGTELAYQINAFRESDWGLTQSLFGSFGFTWAFTMGAIGLSRWRRQVLADPNSSELERNFSKRFHIAVWWSLG